MQKLALIALVATVTALPATAGAAVAGISQVTLVRTITGSNVAGRWTMKLTAKGTRFEIRRDGVFGVRGRITEGANNRLTFRDTGGPGACTGSAVSGRYRYRQVSKGFVFTAVDDPCPSRKAVLAGSWKVLSAS